MHPRPSGQVHLYGSASLSVPVRGLRRMAWSRRPRLGRGAAGRCARDLPRSRDRAPGMGARRRRRRRGALRPARRRLRRVLPIRVAHSAAAIRSAPGIGSEPRIDQSEERRLYDHYGLGYSETDSGSGLPADEPTPASSRRPRTPGAPTSPSRTRGRSPGRGARGRGRRDVRAAGGDGHAAVACRDEPESSLERRRRGADEPRAAAGRAAVGGGDRGGRHPGAARGLDRAEDFTATTEPDAPAELEPTPERPTPELEAPADTPELIAPTSAGEILAATPEAEDLKATPGPDAVRATEPPPRLHQAPPPAPEPRGRWRWSRTRKTTIADRGRDRPRAAVRDPPAALNLR